MAFRIVDMIIEMNGGNVPSTCSEWGCVAQQIDCSLHIVRDLQIGRAYLLDDVIYAKDAPYKPLSMRNVLCHEIAEAALRWEGTEPLCCPCEGDDYHIIAKRVEAYLRIFSDEEWNRLKSDGLSYIAPG